MIDDRTKTTVCSYLQRHFPVKRLKDDTTNRFRRGIILSDAFNSEKYFFSPKVSANKLFSAIYDDLEKVFGLNSEDLTPILFEYLYLDKYYKT